MKRIISKLLIVAVLGLLQTGVAAAAVRVEEGSGTSGLEEITKKGDASDPSEYPVAWSLSETYMTVLASRAYDSEIYVYDSALGFDPDPAFTGGESDSIMLVLGYGGTDYYQFSSLLYEDGGVLHNQINSEMINLTDGIFGFAYLDLSGAWMPLPTEWFTRDDGPVDMYTFNGGGFSVTGASPVPLPGAVLIFGSSLLAMIGVRRRKK